MTEAIVIIPLIILWIILVGIGVNNALKDLKK